MLNIDIKKLNQKYREGDLNYFFQEAWKITDFLLSSKFKVYDEEKRHDEIQNCLEDLLIKHQKGKINRDSPNLMAFVWQNSNFKKLGMLKIERRRAEIAPMISYDIEENIYILGIDSNYGQAEIDKIFEDEIPPNSKMCVECRKYKKFTDFRKHKRTLDGYTKMCRSCYNSRRLKHKEEGEK